MRFSPEILSPVMKHARKNRINAQTAKRDSRGAGICLPCGAAARQSAGGAGAFGLGAGKWHMIRTILLPSSMPGIITGVILAIGRIVGESAALLFTAGSAKALPKTLSALFPKIFQSGGTLTIQLYLSATSEGDFDTAFGIAVVLLVIVLLINLGTKKLASKFDVTRRK